MFCSLPFCISRKQPTPHPPPSRSANRARGGHPRTAHYAKMSSKGRIELQMGVSGAEIREKPAGDVRFCVAPQKPIKNSEKLIFRSIFQKFSERVRVLPNASSRIQTHLNASEQVRAGPSNSENLKKLTKTCEKLAKTSRKILKKKLRSRLCTYIFNHWPQ